MRQATPFGYETNLNCRALYLRGRNRAAYLPASEILRNVASVDRKEIPYEKTMRRIPDAFQHGVFCLCIFRRVPDDTGVRGLELFGHAQRQFLPHDRQLHV